MKFLITGGTSGIGRALAENLLTQGHQVAIIGRKPGKVADLVDQYKELARVYQCDVRLPEEVTSSYHTIKSEIGIPDVVILNAGVGFFGNLEDLTHEQFDLQFDTNVKGVFNWLKVTLPDLKRQNKGQIVITSSNLGIETSPRASIYAATKHAIQAMVSCLRKELVGSDVKVATVNPGSVDTPWFDGKKVDRSRMLDVEAVVKAFLLIIEQNQTSDIERIVLLPAKRST